MILNRFPALLGDALRQRDGAPLLRTLARARVRARALAAHGQSLAMTDAAIAAQVHQSLDAHRHLAAQIAFDGELADVLAQLVHLRIGEVLDLRVRRDACRHADRLRARTTDAVDRRQRDLRMLMVRNVYACNTRHELTYVCRLRRRRRVSLAAACDAHPP